MIKGDKKNLGKWKIGIMEHIFKGKGNTIRSIRICTGNSVTERPIQLLYAIQLHCDSKTTTSNTDYKTMNNNAEEFQTKITAAAVAEKRIRDIANHENQ